jgi:predicted lipid-binding transport protein (Tim44 family)
MYRLHNSAAERMPEVFDIYTIIFLALAVFIFLRLRSVLGQRTGRERPPYDPYSAPDAVRNATSDKVVTLPQRNAEQPARQSEPAEGSPDRYAGFALPGSQVARGLDAISAADRNFDVKQFTAGARAAYETIVTAYATGDRRSLKGLLEREVYDGFDAVIRQREVRGETVESRFVSIDASEILNAQLRGKIAQITLRFVSQLVSATRNRNDNVIDGSADSVTSVTDIWTFAREVTSRDPNWKLVATEGGA